MCIFITLQCCVFFSPVLKGFSPAAYLQAPHRYHRCEFAPAPPFDNTHRQCTYRAGREIFFATFSVILKGRCLGRDASRRLIHILDLITPRGSIGFSQRCSILRVTRWRTVLLRYFSPPFCHVLQSRVFPFFPPRGHHRPFPPQVSFSFRPLWPRGPLSYFQVLL